MQRRTRTSVDSSGARYDRGRPLTTIDLPFQKRSSNCTEFSNVSLSNKILYDYRVFIFLSLRFSWKKASCVCLKQGLEIPHHAKFERRKSFWRKQSMAGAFRRLLSLLLVFRGVAHAAIDAPPWTVRRFIICIFSPANVLL